MDKGSERMLRFEEGKGIPTPVQPEHPWKAQKPHCRDSHGGLARGQRLGGAQGLVRLVWPARGALQSGHGAQGGARRPRRQPGRLFVRVLLTSTALEGQWLGANALRETPRTPPHPSLHPRGR